jgi:hypothetical protein
MIRDIPSLAKLVENHVRHIEIDGLVSKVASKDFTCVNLAATKTKLRNAWIKITSSFSNHIHNQATFS